MIKNYVVVTTIIDPYRTSSLVDKYLLDEDIAEVWIYDNGHKEEDAQHLYGYSLNKDRCIYFNTRGKNLAQQWNDAIIRAAGLNGNLIISNDDIEIEGNLGKSLGEVLRSEDNIGITYPANKVTDKIPEETNGTFGDGGMRGDCFMIKPEIFKDNLVDERFTYWGLDDDIAQTATKLGYKQLRVYSCSMQSDMQGTTSTPGFEWMLNARGDDTKLLKEKWNVKR